MKDEYFILQAYQEALKSTMTKRYGAVLVHNNKIVSKGHNYSTSLCSSNKYYVL